MIHVIESKNTTCTNTFVLIAMDEGRTAIDIDKANGYEILYFETVIYATYRLMHIAGYISFLLLAVCEKAGLQILKMCVIRFQIFLDSRQCH